MKKEDFAAQLNGRSYTDLLSSTEQEEALRARLLVVIAGDDEAEFWGIIQDVAYLGFLEIGRAPKGPWEVYMDEDMARLGRHAPPTATLDIAQADGADEWEITTDIPHATFEVMENGKLHCRGVVIEEADLINSLKPQP
jgi:hypothetical protein